MKRIHIIFVFAVMLILTACGNKTETISPNVGAEQTQQVQPVQKAQEEQITEADTQSVIQPLEGSYQDFVSLDREGDIEYDLPADYRLPKLNMEGEITEAFQAWADAMFAGFSRTLDYYVDRLETEEMHVDYRCGISDDILTVTIGLNGHPFDCWPDAIESFTIDLHTGQQLTLDGFVERYGTWEQMEDFMVRFLIKYFMENEDPRSSDPTPLSEAYIQILSTENLKQSTITLNAYDELFPIVIRVPYFYNIHNSSGQITESDTPCGIMYVRARTVEEIFGKQ